MNRQRLLMTEDAEKDLLEKIASCLEKGDLDACVGDVIALAKKMEISELYQEDECRKR